MDKSFTKVYKKIDKGKSKVGSVPDITIKDNLPPLAQDTPLVVSEAPAEKENESDKEKISEEVKTDNVDSESDILFTMNVDTQGINIVLDKETAKEKKFDAINVEKPESPVKNIDNQQNIEIPAGKEKEQEQTQLEPTVNKNEDKSEKKEEKVDKEEVKEEQPEKFETENILDNVDISDFTPDEIVMEDQLVDDQLVNTQTETIVITDDDIDTNDVDAIDSVNEQVDDVQMYEQLQGQEEKKDGEDKSSEEPPVHTQTVSPLVNDSKKNKEEEKTEENTEDKPKEKKEEEEKETKKSKPKLGQLVNDVGEQMKTFEDAAYVYVEKEYKKLRTKQLMKDIDKPKVALTKKKEAEKELKVLSDSFKPLNDSAIYYGRSIVELQHKLKAYESE
ncbi:uncharacterized protein LOC131857696 [Cryptomeria japonica]|uniref:uncharacterized protein LOC131857696 n=1 Tax=Cryptomeria japonica TaxID=3369 RepID=UPI0027D9E631|nr:uncharacterized protein LOC131857696 [Cryptomeria japonica]